MEIMRLTKEHLINNVMTLGRALTVVSPDMINGMLSMEAAFSQKKLDVGHLNDRWFCRRAGDQISYFYISEDGYGRYTKEAPPGVDTSKIPIVDIDPNDLPGFELLEQLSLRLNQLSSGAQVKIEESGEPIEFICTDADDTLESLRQYLVAVRIATSETINEDIVGRASARLRKAIFLSLKEGESVLKNELNKIAGEIAQLRSVLGADGRLASYFMVYRDVCIAVEDFYVAKGNKSRAKQELVRYVAFGSAGAVRDPLTLITRIIQKLAREDLYELADGLGHRYLRKGEQFIDQALGSMSIDYFSGALYTAGLFFFASRQIFEALSECTAEVIAVEELESYRRATKFADEKTTLVCTALINAVQNRTGEKLQMHRQLVEEARCRGGQVAAEQEVFQLIEMKYYYPRYFQEILMNNEQVTGASI